ncbi:MAG: ferrous iron transport protein [Pseudomonadota bacterium]|jgi:ferrous iron transport protein B
MRKVALIGMPNTGKSTFFNRITGSSARVGNWPGVTVDLMTAKVILGDVYTQVIDLPGIYSFHGFSEDEKVVRNFIEKNPVDLICVVVNATQIDRQLSLALQVKMLGLPVIIVINMADEAQRHGIEIDKNQLESTLGVPVELISAKYGAGMDAVARSIAKVLKRNDDRVSADLSKAFDEDRRIENEASRVLDMAVKFPIRLEEDATARIDRVVLHPWFGLPIFFALMLLLFEFIFRLGKPMQDAVAWVLTQVREQGLDLWMVDVPPLIKGLLLDGIYNGVGTVAAFVPIIILFFLMMTLVEDSGYLSRVAYLMDTLMSRLGLDGRSFVMLLMGFGCNVPALMGTRVMRSRALRLLTMLVIPFSLCSARLQVFLFLTGALFSTTSAPLVLFSLYLLSFAGAILTAFVFKGRYVSNEPFVLELPPYRLPTPRQVMMRAWLEVQHFLVRASKFITAGVVAVWLLTNLPPGSVPNSPETFAGHISDWLSPVLSPIGIDAQLGLALIFGFVAKEIVVGSLAAIYGLEGDALVGLMSQKLDWVQGYSFMLFTLIYVPCLSTIATLKSESRSWGFTWLSILWSLILAWLVSFVFYQSARYLGY